MLYLSDLDIMFVRWDVHISFIHSSLFVSFHVVSQPTSQGAPFAFKFLVGAYLCVDVIYEFSSLGMVQDLHVPETCM